MNQDNFKQAALKYHQLEKPGKIETIPTKKSKTQRDLSLAYSPGVAEPCKEIFKNKDNVYKYTSKGNLVAVITNGSAVLGLGDIGAEASKPVMEGKGVLFKVFADIDVFDLEINCNNVDEFCRIVKALEPTFGGINLEDIKAPSCFAIEERLKKEMNIPVMHDDQHGTAIIAGAAFLNAIEITKRLIEEVKIVVSGAGASAISCIKTFIALGVSKENIIICDSKGVIHKSRSDLSDIKKEFATNKDIFSLKEAMKNSDMFLGLSQGKVVTSEMLLSMAKDPIVFALANPEPEIDYPLAIKTRKDIIMATGRSDYNNQVNNVLGFPFIFRGALDVKATKINNKMKIAAIKAIANLAKKVVPESVLEAYNKTNITFGKDYIIPKPMDNRLITEVAPAVAKAAMDSKVARFHIEDFEIYKQELTKRMGHDHELMTWLIQKAKRNPKRVVFVEGEDLSVLKAAHLCKEEGIAVPILLGNERIIEKKAKEFNLNLSHIEIINPKSNEEILKKYTKIFYESRKRKGQTLVESLNKVSLNNYFAAIMLREENADALVTGIIDNYAVTIKSIIESIGDENIDDKIIGMFVVLTKKGPLFFADTAMIENPTTEEIVYITKKVAHSVKNDFKITPHIALLSYSNFGSANGNEPKKMQKAVEILHKENPDLIVDGEIHANFALDNETLKQDYSFCKLAGKPVNVLIFPNLSAANLSYKLVEKISGNEVIGPIHLGVKKPVHVMQIGSSVRDIFNMVSVASVTSK